MSSDAQTETTEHRSAPPADAAADPDAAAEGRHRGHAASDDLVGRREPAGHGRHRRAQTVRDSGPRQ
ncbi:hypothetical protein [Phaeacidiphilus oryzae]|jgi:hypothetical protein|uniref:hypothetical protein n=1 Tax=Phaeacidiphilus oryzae TaxID=348818 RepID=UPI0005663230|nr:hypothetical protein [Phaeacidiphilus oryzae]